MSGGGMPDYSLSYINDRQTIAVLGGIWHDVRFEYDVDDNAIYKGVHEIHDAATDAVDWEIWKFTWVAGNCTRIEGPLRGSWDGRATLGWGA